MYSNSNWRTYGIHPIWFSIWYLDQIMQLGEYHLFFLGGKCVHSIVMKPMEDRTNLYMDLVKAVILLQQIR